MNPPHWPSTIKYSPRYTFDSKITPEIKALIQGSTSKGGGQSSGRPPVVIRRIDLQGHPAFGEYGLFATKKIPPKTFILYYFGEVHSDDRPDSNYDLSLYRAPDSSVHIGIDATATGNEVIMI